MFARPYATMIYATDMKASVAFYCEHFGFQTKFAEEGWSELSLGGHTLAVHSAEEVLPRTETTPQLILEVVDIRAEVETLKTKGVNIGLEVESVGGDAGWCAAAVDPSGNWISLYQAGPGPA